MNADAREYGLILTPTLPRRAGLAQRGRFACVSVRLRLQNLLLQPLPGWV